MLNIRSVFKNLLAISIVEKLCCVVFVLSRHTTVYLRLSLQPTPKQHGSRGVHPWDHRIQCGEEATSVGGPTRAPPAQPVRVPQARPVQLPGEPDWVIMLIGCVGSMAMGAEPCAE